MTMIDITETADRVVARLNRPDVRNAIDQQMIDELHTLCAHLESIPKILILIGADGVFASGADIRQLRDRTAEDALRGINARAFQRVAVLPMPVIAALDGYALGGGAELAYAADLRIGTPRLRIGNPEPGLGIIAGAGALWRLRKLVGEPMAKEILLAGRVLDGAEALAVNLITRLVEPPELLAAAHELADRIAAWSPAAVQATKRVFAVRDDEHPDVDLREQAVLFESGDKYARMTAFLDRSER
jgi:enoyl-CoA hydratase